MYGVYVRMGSSIILVVRYVDVYVICVYVCLCMSVSLYMYIRTYMYVCVCIVVCGLCGSAGMWRLAWVLEDGGWRIYELL